LTIEPDRLIEQLRSTFLLELEEHVRTLNQGLLVLEKDPGGAPRTDSLTRVFRAAHSLKGAARAVHVPLVEAACHRLEEILADVRDRDRPLTPDLFALLFAATDALDDAGRRLKAAQDLAGSPLDEVSARLDEHGAGAAARTASPAARRDRRAATAAPPPRPEREPRRPASAEPAPTRAANSSPEATVRVAAHKLDQLLAWSGELLVARRRLAERQEEISSSRTLFARWRKEWERAERPLRTALQTVDAAALPASAHKLPARTLRVLGAAADTLRRMEREIDRLSTEARSDRRQIELACQPLDEEIRRVRMLPFSEACQGIERIVRDLGRATGKDVDLVLDGVDVELDRTVIEVLRDPLRHLVRNALDHGVELPLDRRAAGKPARARLSIGAAVRGAQVAVTIADDGRGLDLDAIRAQARKRGLPEPDDPSRLARLIFEPGFSTAPIVTDVSGRGVGLDVVKAQIESLHGSIDLDWGSGRGTCFTLTVPLTLTILRALLVACGGQTYAFASTNVRRLVRLDPSEVRTVRGREMLITGEAPLPVASLAATLGTASTAPVRRDGRMLAAVVAAGERQMAFVVEDLVAEQDVMVKPLGRRIRHASNISGATLLPSGDVALVLNAGDLIRTALGRAGAATRAGAPARPVRARRRLMVADDSLTTRTLEKTILEAAGYDVLVAPDGEAAWRLLQERGADLLVSDVDMPRLDGFGLAAAVRASERFRALPVVLVTARESDADKARGIEVGADAYLVKGAFDQTNLLETIRQLLGD
jgi:two-component system chemotaxis sensor kinase CheA